ncbi:hypothetical protein [Bradyrhizobium sp. BWA-3-5]|uniref:hypothetical protein n=1 Tax=Bradyrhizobium sp. BWA-3-5 TaxID=3080013 RepID=UPI00293ED49E|nr:hypothetical protein [Bradyrhizobium sp. BWA-3-5]WOH67883.1 hypothetical protein RX331_09225 [Bradyrhizobium sp. BWA-3-5]
MPAADITAFALGRHRRGDAALYPTDLSRSAIHSCLQRYGISQRSKAERLKAGIFEQTAVGFIHIDLNHVPALERRKSYVYVAIDRATRYAYVEVHSRRDANTSASFLKLSWLTSPIRFIPS